MEKAHFEELFSRIVEKDLIEVGFRKRGRHLLLTEGDLQFALIRAGGKLLVPHGIVHILGLRGSCMRECKELEILEHPPNNSGDYPLRCNPEALELEGPDQWKLYHHERFNPPYGHYYFGDKTEEEVALHLGRLVYNIRHRWLAWARDFKLASLVDQLRKHESEWWIVRVWLEDLRRAGLANQRSQEQ